MATKPTAQPTWATAGSNNTEPTSGQKATGWTPNQVGNSSYENWRGKLLSDWTQWLDVLASGAGAFSLDVAAESAPSSEYTGTPARRKLLTELNTSSAAGSGGRKVRIYVEGDATGANGWLLTVNALWNYGTSMWNIDDSTRGSTALLVVAGAFAVYSASPNAFPCDDGGFFAVSTYGAAITLDFLDASLANPTGIARGCVLGARVNGDMRVVGPGATWGFCHEDFRVVGASGQPTFQNSWVAASGLPNLCFWRDAFGAVHIEGAANGPTASVVFTLPTGYRPQGSVSFPVFQTGGGTLVLGVAASGNVTISGGSGTVGAMFQVVFHPDVALAP